MATGWSIRIGYISGSSTKMDSDDAFKHMMKFAKSLMHNPQAIYDECKAFDCPDTEPDLGYNLMDVCETFSLPYLEGGPASIHDEPDEFEKKHADDFVPYIHVMASGGMRHIKEETRRAFVRLILKEMHKIHVDVSISVA